MTTLNSQNAYHLKL